MAQTTNSSIANAGAEPTRRDGLASSDGSISVAETVVQKVAGIAAREINGVYAMGTGASRAIGSLRQRIPGSSGPNVAAGVAVEVGESEAAIDVDVIVEYGVSIAELGRSIQRNVKQAVERMTGLKVVEVNVSVNDMHFPGDDEERQDAPARVS